MFGKKKRNYKIFKLFKIVDILQSKSFLTKQCFEMCLSFISTKYGKLPDYYEINYGERVWKSKQFFEKEVIKMPNENIVIVMSNYTGTLTSLTLENSILNLTTIPKFGLIDLEISIDKENYTYDETVNFLKLLSNNFSFDYGYLVELSEDYDFGSERKINKGIFGAETTTNESDHIWRFHSLGIKEGFIKRLYLLNIINSSHLNQPVIKKLLDNKIGKLYGLNGELWIWTLSPEEFDIAQEALTKTKFVIQNDENYKLFSESAEAKIFYEQMKI